MNVIEFLAVHYANYNVVLAGVPNLSLTMYPFSIPTDDHVPLQHFDTC